MIPNSHGPALHVRDWNRAASASQDLSRTGRLVEQETDELLEACAGGDPAQIAKEACDVIWTAIDVLVAHDIDFHRAFLAVARSNWSKIEGGIVLRGDDGKILKGPRYRPPRPDDLIPRVVR